MRSAQFQLHAAVEDSHWWFSGRRRIMRELVRHVLPATGRPGVVDVGCGTGANLAALARDYDCVGIDTSREAIELARSRFPGLRLICGHAPADLGGMMAEARLILLMDVIEHVPDDFAFLSGLLAASAPGTHVLVTVPANPAFWSEHDESNGHYRRYDADRLRRVWEGLPVTTRLLTHYNSRLYPVASAVRAWSGWRGRATGRAGTDVSLPVRPVNAALRTVFAGESRILVDLLLGRRGRGYSSGVSLVALLLRERGEIGARSRPDDVATDVHDPLIGRRQPGRRPHPRSAPGEARAMSKAIIVIPCYHEALRLDVGKFRDFARDDRRQRFLFVDDGSTDETADVLEALRRSDPESFSVCRMRENAGKAEAVRRGVLLAFEDGPEYVGYWDADLATPLEATLTFRSLLDSRPDIDMVFGTRVSLLGRSVERNPLRHYLGRIFARAASLAPGVSFYDTQCGAKLFRASPEVAALFREPFRTRWIFDVEILSLLNNPVAT